MFRIAAWNRIANLCVGWLEHLSRFDEIECDCLKMYFNHFELQDFACRVCGTMLGKKYVGAENPVNMFKAPQKQHCAVLSAIFENCSRDSKELITRLRTALLSFRSRDICR